MRELRFTLVSDGSSDQALLPHLRWLLLLHGVAMPLQGAWADLRWLPHPPRTLTKKIARAVELHPCDLLFVHRDAEKAQLDIRREEILREIPKARKDGEVPRAICVVPVRMQEAWLLFDEAAIRWAAGDPHGQQPLPLPPLARLEQVPDPKADLYQLLRAASGTRGRRLQKFRPEVSARRVAEFIEDSRGFSSLLALPAFKALSDDVRAAVTQHGWKGQ